MDDKDDVARTQSKLSAALSQGDAAARNMVRHLAALEMMLTGRQRPEHVVGEPVICASFELTPNDREFLVAIALQNRIGQIILTFDGDGTGSPSGILVIHVEDDGTALCMDCDLWSACDEEIAWIVPIRNGPGDRFGFRPGRPLLHERGTLHGNPEPGFRRAAARLKRIAGSAELRDADLELDLHEVESNGETMRWHVTKLLG